MQTRVVLIILLFTISGCSRRSELERTSEPTQPSADSAALMAQASGIVDAYRKELDKLPATAASSIEGLKIFRDKYRSEDRSLNDGFLRKYLAFQSRLIDSLNEDLYDNPIYDELAALTWDDTTRYTQRAKDFNRALEDSGFLLASAEGGVYINTNPDIIERYFFEHLTDGGKLYFRQLARETAEGFAEDGGLTISLRDLADRVGFWDNFIRNHPDNIFVWDAPWRKNLYLRYFLSGMDNTPAFDHATRKLNDDFRAAFDYFVKTYSSTPSASVVRDYLELLRQEDFKFTERVDRFVEALPE